MIVQHYAAPDKDSFGTKSIDFFYIERMIASYTFSPDEDWMTINLLGES